MKRTLLCILLALLQPFSSHLNADTVLVLGDSISAAYGIQRAEGWVALLEQKLDKLDDNHVVVNGSISGETTGGGLARLGTMLVLHKPDIVILELGGNDGLRGYPIEIIQDNMKQMLELIQSVEAKVLILGMRIPPNYGTRYTEAFYNIYQNLPKSPEHHLIPFFMEGIGDQPELMQADQVHPTSQAQPILLSRVWNELSKMLGVQ